MTGCVVVFTKLGNFGSFQELFSVIEYVRYDDFKLTDNNIYYSFARLFNTLLAQCDWMVARPKFMKNVSFLL